MVFNEQDFGHGTEGASRSSPPETVEVQPTSDIILKQEEEAETKQKDDVVSEAVDPVVNQSMIGSLLYAAVGTKDPTFLMQLESCRSSAQSQQKRI